MKATHIGIDTTNGERKHPIEICEWGFQESDKISQRKYSRKQARLYRASNETIEDAVSSPESRF